VGTEWGHGPVNQRPESVDSSGQESGILVVRRHDDAESFVGTKILGQSQGDTGAAAGIGGVDDRVLLKLWNEGNARIFDAPDFFRMEFRESGHGWFGIDHPIVDSIHGARRTEVRVAAAVFHATQEKSGPIGQKRGARVEDAVNGIRPILCGQDGIQGVASEQDIGLNQGFNQMASGNKKTGWCRKPQMREGDWGLIMI